MKKIAVSKLLCGILVGILTVSLVRAEEANLEKLKKPPKVGDALQLPLAKLSLKFSKENGRIYYLPFSLKGRTKLRVTIVNGNDNTGDGGVTWRLMDSQMKDSFGADTAKKKKGQSWVVSGIRSSNVILVLEDKDTNFSGKYPGNRIDVAVKFPK